MDALECISTKLDVREFDSEKRVSQEVKLNVLSGARLTGSGNNSQHWRFVLVQDRASVRKLAEDSITGKWAATCNFAIIVLTDPKLPFHLIDAGRAIQDMQLAAWNSGLASGLFTGINDIWVSGKISTYRADLTPLRWCASDIRRRRLPGKRKIERLSPMFLFLRSLGIRWIQGNCKRDAHME